MLGDLDLGLHLVRTQALRAGEPLSAVTARLAAAAGLATRILPATDDRAPDVTSSPRPARFAFQEWFVARGHEDEVDAVVFEGAETATPAPGVVEALHEADAIVVAPSNPYVSIQPDPRGRRDPGGPRRPRQVALRRGQPADRWPRREGARSTVCSRAWPAGRHLRTWQAVTRA